MLATAPLFLHHMSAANYEAAEFAQALQPFIGHWGAALFALGMFEAGMVAAVTISTSSAYAFGEVARRPHSLNLPFKPREDVLSGPAGAKRLQQRWLVLIPGIPLVYIVLLVNVIAVLAMPPALLFLYMLVNDREIMGDTG